MDPNQTSTDETDERTNPDQASQEQEPEIDIQKLADKVYRLMLVDLRLAHARGQRTF
jgi:hypothetical protein